MHHCSQCGTEFVAARAECSDCGAAVVAGPSPRFASPAAKRPPAARPEAPPPLAQPFQGPRPSLPASGLRHCRTCQAEFDSALVDCSDCGAPLFPGGAPRFDSATNTAGDDELTTDDFVPLHRIDNGWQADMLCSVLADAGIATMMETARGRRMRAPGLEPIGPAPAENESVEILVFPELLDDARVVLEEAEALQADREIVVPSDGPGAGCGSNCAPTPTATSSSSPVAIVLGGLVVLVGLAAALLFR